MPYLNREKQYRQKMRLQYIMNYVLGFQTLVEKSINEVYVMY